MSLQPICLVTTARPARPASNVEKMTLKFEDWLTAQQGRKDLVGDLARVPSLQNVDHEMTRRKPDEHQKWADLVIRIAEPGHIYVFNDAWQEFLLAKQAAAQGSPD